MSTETMHVLTAIPWFGWVAIVAMICGCVSGAIQQRCRHAERMEMIRQGLNPDGGKPAGPPEV